jgi:hypothetical protein
MVTPRAATRAENAAWASVRCIAPSIPVRPETTPTGRVESAPVSRQADRWTRRRLRIRRRCGAFAAGGSQRGAPWSRVSGWRESHPGSNRCGRRYGGGLLGLPPRRARPCRSSQTSKRSRGKRPRPQIGAWGGEWSARQSSADGVQRGNLPDDRLFEASSDGKELLLDAPVDSDAARSRRILGCRGSTKLISQVAFVRSGRSGPMVLAMKTAAAREAAPEPCASDQTSDARCREIRALRYAAGDLCCACADRRAERGS